MQPMGTLLETKTPGGRKPTPSKFSGRPPPPFPCPAAFCLPRAWLGLFPRVVGRTAIAVAVFTLLPFVVLVLWGLPDCTMPESWLSPPDGGWGAIRWGTYLNVMFW